MSNKFEIILEAGLDKESSASRIDKELEALSKKLKIEVSPTLKKDIQKEIDTMNNALKKASDVKITPKVDAKEIQQITKEITDLDKRQINLDFSKINRQFDQVLGTNKEFKKDLQDMEKISIEVLDKGSQQNLKELKMSMKELKEFGMQEKPGANSINKMAEDMERLRFKFSETIGQSDEMNSKMEILSNTINSLSSSDSVGIGKAKEDVREMGVALKELEKSFKDMETASQKSDLFEIEGRDKMIRSLDSLKLQYKDLIQGSDEYKKSLQELEQVARTVKFDDISGQKGFDNAVKNMRMELRELNAESKNTESSMAGLGGVFNNIGGQLTMLAGRVLSLQFAMKHLREGFGYIQEIDSSLTEIAMVTNQSIGDVQGWGEQYRELARDLKVSNAEITEGAVGFVRQGLEQEEVMERLATTSKFARISAIKTSEATELLTATVNGMNVDIERASDVMIYMGDSTATSGEEIAKGLQKTAGSAGALGVEFEKVSSWIATISAQTRQAPQTVGATINSILARMSKISTKGFDEGDGTSFNDVAKALDRVGIAMMDNEGNFRNYGDILDEVAQKWDTLSQAEKQYLGTQLAGTHRLSNFFQLMDSYSDSLDLYHESLDAGGTTNEKYEIYLESLEAKIGELKGAVEDLYATLLETETLHKVIEAITGLVNGLQRLIETFGLGGTAVGAFSMLMGGKLITSMLGATNVMGGLVAKMGLAVPHIALLAGVLIGAPIVIGKVADAWRDYQDSLPTPERLTEQIESYREESRETEDLIANLDALQYKRQEMEEAGKNTAEIREQELEIGYKLAEMYPELANAVDETGKAYVSATDDVKNFVDESEKARVKELESSLFEVQGNLEEKKAELREYKKEIQNFYDDIKASTEEELRIKINSGDMQEKQAEIQGVRSAIQEVSGQVDKWTKSEQILKDELDAINQRQTEREQRLLVYQMQMAETSEEVARFEGKLMDMGFTSVEVAQMMEHGFDVTMQAMRNAQGVSFDYVMSLNSMSQAEASATKALIDQEVARTKVKIEQTKKRIQAMSEELKALQALHGGKGSIYTGIGDVPEGQLGGATNAKVRERAAKTSAKFLEGQIREQKNRVGELENFIKQAEDAVNHIDSITVGTNVGAPSAPRSTPTDRDSLGKSKKSPKGKKKSAKKKKEEYQAEVDYYIRINALLDKNSSAQERNNIEQKLAGDNISKKIKWMNQEIKLEQQRQGLLHTKAQMLRKERADLESQLTKQGFKFEGEGDDKLIANITHLKGKTKETEEAFKRFFDIQTKELPPLSNEWMKLKDQINQLKIDRINLHMEIFNREAETLEDNLKKVQHRMAMIDDMKTFDNPTAEWDSINEKIDLQAETYKILGQQVSLAQAKYQEYKNMGLDPVLAQTKEYIDELRKLEEAVRSAELAEFQSAQQYKQLVMEKNKLWVAERNKEYDEQRKRLSALDAMQEEIVKIIKKRGELEKKELDKRHKEEMKALDKQQKEYDKAYKKDLDRYKKLIQDKLDALKDSWAEEDYQDQLKKEREELNDMLRDLAEISLDDSLSARAKAIALQKKIDDQEEKIAKMQRDKERKDTEELLKDKLKNHEDTERDKMELQKESFEREKEMLKERQEQEKEALNAMYEDNKVYAEAREALINDQVKTANGALMDVESAIIDFNTEFGKIMGIMGDDIQKNFIDQWKEAGKALQDFEYQMSNFKQKYDSSYNAYEGGHISKPNSLPSSSDNRGSGLTEVRPKGFENWSDSDFHRYLSNKRAWDAGGKQEKQQKAVDNADLREKYWGENGRNKDNFSYEQLEYEMELLRRKKIAGYKTGGFVPRDGYVMAHEKEMFVPDMYQKQLWEFIQNPQLNLPTKLPTVDTSAQGFGDISITIPVEGSLDHSVLPDLEKTIVKVVSKIEQDRGVKMRSNGIKLNRR